MSWTANADFDFTGLGFTQGADFDFSGGTAQPYDLTLTQTWTQAGAGIEEGQFGQQWALAAQTRMDATLSQSWALAAPRFSDTFANQRWALAAPVFRNLSPDQRWALLVPTFAGAEASQQWALTTPTFADVPAAQAWNSTAPMIQLGAFDQLWRLDATAVWTRVVSATAYIFALEQGTDRAEIPMANFSGQFRSGEPSYLQVSIPDAWTHAATIAAYAAHEDTELVISAGYRYSDGSYDTQEIARTTLRNVQYYYGSTSASVNLDGTDTRTNTSPASHTLTGASYFSIDTTGQTRYRCPPNFSVRPGDTVTVNGETFVVGELSWQVSDRNAVMEVAQAIAEA